MQDLVDSMGINRASMYTTFGNKRDLFDLSFDTYCASSLDNIRTTLSAPGPALKNLKQLFAFLIETEASHSNYGCFANNAAVELGPHDNPIAEKVRAFWQGVENAIKSCLDSAVSNGELPPDIDSENLARFINAQMQGLSVMRKAGVNVQSIKQSVQQLFSLLGNARS
jgi:TetR/AcrR family transcriptional repressor of nem operon